VERGHVNAVGEQRSALRRNAHLPSCTAAVTRPGQGSFPPGHVEGFGGTLHAFGALVGLISGTVLLMQGRLIGSLIVVSSLWLIREAYLRYRAGNWP
jgi:hypothetical protein